MNLRLTLLMALLFLASSFGQEGEQGGETGGEGGETGGEGGESGGQGGEPESPTSSSPTSSSPTSSSPASSSPTSSSSTSSSPTSSSPTSSSPTSSSPTSSSPTSSSPTSSSPTSSSPTSTSPTSSSPTSSSPTSSSPTSPSPATSSPTTTLATTAQPSTSQTTATPSTTTPLPFPRDSCPSGSTFTCKDCQNLLICDGRTNVIGTLNCQRNNPRLPYCSVDRCSATQDVQCLPASKLCPAEGFYPHPFNCNRYNICTQNRQALELSCPTNWVYNNTLNGCVPRTRPSDCVVANCAWSTGLLVPYPGDTSLFVFCAGGANNALLQCPDGAVFDPNQRTCGRKICEKEGFVANPDDPSKYYICYLSNGQLQYYESQCPGGLVFDPVNSRCTLRT